jgi:amidophosphoribosyltransferase
LIGANQTVEEIRRFIGADSLGYLSAEGMLEAFGRPARATCAACFTGIYPVEVPEEEREKEALVVMGSESVGVILAGDLAVPRAP